MVADPWPIGGRADLRQFLNPESAGLQRRADGRGSLQGDRRRQRGSRHGYLPERLWFRDRRPARVPHMMGSAAIGRGPRSRLPAHVEICSRRFRSQHLCRGIRHPTLFPRLGGIRCSASDLPSSIQSRHRAFGVCLAVAVKPRRSGSVAPSTHAVRANP